LTDNVNVQLPPGLNNPPEKLSTPALNVSLGQVPMGLPLPERPAGKVTEPLTFDRLNAFGSVKVTVSVEVPEVVIETGLTSAATVRPGAFTTVVGSVALAFDVAPPPERTTLADGLPDAVDGTATLTVNTGAEDPVAMDAVYWQVATLPFGLPLPTHPQLADGL